MKTLLRPIAGLLIAWALCVSVAAPAQAGYGNHAERATVNIMTRAEIARLRILAEAAERQAIAEALFAKR